MPRTVKVFTSSGTWTCPAGVTRVLCTIRPGGGGGGGGGAGGQELPAVLWMEVEAEAARVPVAKA